MSRMKKWGFNTADDGYFRWLLDIVGDEYNGFSYLLMLKDLFNTTYIWSVPNDDNRYWDAINLSREYNHRRYGEEANVLEVLVALSYHLDENMYDSEVGEVPEKWFWVMINNLNLLEFDDENYEPVEIERILRVFLDRKYDTSGAGGLFPLRYGRKNQRRVEIWYQMFAWINENYVF